MRAAVIGGGWAGMAAAVELAQAGVPVTVYEAARTLGGRARRVEMHGLALDNGQHILCGAYREALRLIALVNPGTAAAALYARVPLLLEVAGHLRLAAPRLPAPLHLAVALLAARGLGLAERAAALRLMIALRRAGWRVEPDCTVDELLEHYRQPRRLAWLLWQPLCVAALNTPPQLASARAFVHVLRDTLGGARGASDLVLPRVDLSRLFPDPAARFVSGRGGEVRLGCAVRAVWRAARGFVVEADDAREFSHVVCAVPPWRAPDLLSGFPPAAAAVARLDERGYQPIYTVYLQYPPEVVMELPMLGLAEGLVQWVFDRGRLGGPPGLLAAVISAEGTHESLPQRELARRVHEELDSAFGPLPAPLWERVVAEKRATFPSVPGLPRPPQRTGQPRLYLAGDWTAGEHPAVLEGAVRSGIQCAALALEDR